MKGKYQTITLDRLIDPEQPLREDLSRETVKDLVSSIAQVGVINPLVVKKSGEQYEVVAGHRRLVASGIAGLTEVPCIVIKTKGMTGEVIKLQENLVRDNINPIEWAKHLEYLKQQYKLDNAKIAKLLGMSETWVGQHLNILKYPPSLLEALSTGNISFSSARELAQIRDPKKRDIYVNHAIKGGLTPTLAIRWRKEANREPINQQGKTEEGEENTTPTYKPEPLKCSLCEGEIEPTKAVYLTVHEECQPTPAKPSINTGAS